MSRRKKVTMADIAEQLGVSIVTVSKALAGKDGVSDELRQDIIQVAKDMHYIPPMREQSEGEETEQKTKHLNIGILVADHFFQNSNSFYFELYQLAVKQLAELAHFGIVEIVSSYEEAQEIPPKFLEQRHVSGLLVLGQFSASYLRAIAEYRIPTIYVDFNYPELNEDCIVQDNINGSFLATKYLIEHGHRQIGFVGSIHATSSIMERYLGYQRALLTYGLPLHDEWLIEDRDETGIYINMELPETLPTAIVCNSDETAYILIRQLSKKQIRVPEDISIIAFDNSFYTNMTAPRLTTVAVDSEAMVFFAVHDLLRKIDKSDQNWREIRKVIKVQLFERNSVQCLQTDKHKI